MGEMIYKSEDFRWIIKKGEKSGRLEVSRGKILRDMMKMEGISIEELAEASGLKAITVRNMLFNNKVSEKMAEGYKKLTGRDVEYLVSDYKVINTQIGKKKKKR